MYFYLISGAMLSTVYNLSGGLYKLKDIPHPTPTPAIINDLGFTGLQDQLYCTHIFERSH